MNKMSNEELALKVKNGEQGAMLELWKTVHGFVEMQARKRSRLPVCSAPFDDLVQAGFLAVVEAAQKYEQGKGYGFLTALDFYLRNYFAKEDGIRGSKRDALKYASSLDIVLELEESSGSALVDFVEDENALSGFINAEYREFISYCRRLINAALESLSDQQAKAVQLYYYGGLSMEDVAKECNLSSGAAVEAVIFRARYKLLRGKYSVLMHECLEEFEDFHNYTYAAQSSGIGRYRNTGMSSTEAAMFIGV